MLTYTITDTDHCRNVESFLRNLLPAAPAAYLKKLVKSGHITVNGAPASPDTLLRRGDMAALKESARTRSLIAGQRPELDILYEDQWIMVFNKAPGMPVHRAAEVDERNLVELGTRLVAQRGGAGKLRPVNRLDRGTSGVIIMAKSPVAAAMFGMLVQQEGLGKLYLAVAAGRLPAEGTVTAPLDGKEAETRFRTLHQGEGGAIAAVWPLTGRMHQIRQHFRRIGHPVLGDRRYGGPPLSGYAGIALHSFRTTLTHPATGERIIIHAPLPEGFLAIIRRLAGDAAEPLLQSFLNL
jgi:23S rRNA pseudouridine955/2504/2580 synthase